MPAANAIRAGRAFVELFADDSRLVRGLRAASAKLKAWGASIRSIGTKTLAAGAAFAAPVAAATKAFISMGSELDDIAQRTGVSVESLSELGFAAEQSGADLATLETGIRRTQQTINDADRGLSTAVDGLAALGLQVEQLKGLNPEDQFKTIADRLSTIEDPSRRAAMAVQILGRAGTKLLPLMLDGAAGIEALQQQARDLGLTVSTDAAKGAAALGDAVDALWSQVKRAAFGIGGALAPALTEAAAWLSRVSVKAIRWIDSNRELVITIAKLAVGVVGAGVALVALGVSIGAAGSLLGAMATAVTAIVSPIGLVVAAIVGLGTAIFRYTDFGAKALQWLSNRFGFLADEARHSLGAIGHALAAGDLKAAVNVLWAFLKLQWTRGIGFLSTKWAEFTGGLKATAFDAARGVQSLWESGIHAIVLAWINGSAAMKTVWSNFTAWHARTVETLASWMAKRWVEVQGLFDDTIDVEFAQKHIDQQSEQRFGEIEREKDQSVSAAETERQQRQHLAEQEHQRELNAINQKHAQAIADLQNAHNRGIADAADELDEAMKQYQQAVDEANKVTAERRSAPIPGAPQLPGVPDVDSAVDEAARRIEVRGTFSAASIQSLLVGGSRTEDRIANAAEETARNTRRIERAIIDAGIAFA